MKHRSTGRRVARLVATGLMLGVVCGTALAGPNMAEVTLVYPCAPAPGSVRIDGKLDPAEWAGATTVSAFRISGSESLAPQQVVMRVMYDRTHLYLGVTCAESRMKHVVTKATQRDGPFWLDDSIEFFIDPVHDHATYYQFAVTANAVVYDATGQAGITHDPTWNCDWRAAAARGEQAWTVEAAVPLSAFGARRPGPGTLWGFNLCRERQAGGRCLELYNWADVQRRFNNAPLFGHLRFVGPAWRATAAGAQAAAQDVGGSRALVYEPHGYWVVQTGQPAGLHTYRQVLKTATAKPGRHVSELRDIYRQRPKMVRRKEFDALMATHRKAMALVAGDGPVDAPTCARVRTHLDTFNDQVDVIYWRVRLVMLNERM